MKASQAEAVDKVLFAARDLACRLDDWGAEQLTGLSARETLNSRVDGVTSPEFLAPIADWADAERCYAPDPLEAGLAVLASDARALDRWIREDKP